MTIGRKYGPFPSLHLSVFGLMASVTLSGCGVFINSGSSGTSSVLSSACGSISGFYQLPSCIDETSTSQRKSLVLLPDCTTTASTYYFSGPGCSSDNPDSFDRTLIELSDLPEIDVDGVSKISGILSAKTQLKASRRNSANLFLWYGFSDWVLGVEKNVTGLDPLNVSDSKFEEGQVFYNYFKVDSASSTLLFGTMPALTANEISTSPSDSEFDTYSRIAPFGDCSNFSGSYATSCATIGVGSQIRTYIIDNYCQISIEAQIFSDGVCSTAFKTDTRTGVLNITSGSVTSSTGADAIFYTISRLSRPDTTSPGDIALMISENHFGFDDWTGGVEKNITYSNPGSNMPFLSVTQEGDSIGPFVVSIDTSNSPAILLINGDTASSAQ